MFGMEMLICEMMMVALHDMNMDMAHYVSTMIGDNVVLRPPRLSKDSTPITFAVRVAQTTDAMGF
jgi:hypothetical protein